jgi:predicted  nucleic acid-binding Zn-ribbon protein
MIDDLLALQRLDTEIDQLRVRLEQLPERAAAADLTRQLAELEARRAALHASSDELDARIEEEERESAELLDERRRLEAQLRTVIAPREAEALSHEIEGIQQRRDALDDAELEALEQQGRIEEELAVLDERAPSLRESVEHADAALTVVLAEADAEATRLSADRDRHRDVLPAALLADYDRIRSQLGVAVARLEGRKCGGCYLDLSAAEIDDAKDEASSSGLASCPQCGRLLVV